MSCIVCTYNGATRIPAVLDHLARQTLPPSAFFEIVLVDNASTDGTSETAVRHWQALGAPAPLMIVHEPRAGLIHARQAGIRAARYDALSFIDDDNWVCEEWCGRVAAALRDNPRLGAIGGRGVASFEETEPPVWFDQFQMAYAVGPQSNWSRGLPTLARLYGAGLTVRKAALDGLSARGFSPLLAGRTGTSLGAGDDSELCYALSLSGWDLGYYPDLVFKHVMPAKRLSEKYLIELFKGFGASSAVLDLYNWLSARPRRNPAELAVTSSILGLLISLAKLTYWSAHLVGARGLQPAKRLEAEVWSAYFLCRFHALRSNWGLACRRAKAVHNTFFVSDPFRQAPEF